MRQESCIPARRQRLGNIDPVENEMPKYLRKGRRSHVVAVTKEYMSFSDVREICSVSIVGSCCLLQKAVACVRALDPSLHRGKYRASRMPQHHIAVDWDDTGGGNVQLFKLHWSL